MLIAERSVTQELVSGVLTHHSVAIMRLDLVMDTSQITATTLHQPATTFSQLMALSDETLWVVNSKFLVL